MPGVPKFMASPMCGLVPGLAGNNRDVHKKMALPLPPGSFRHLPARSASKRMVPWKEDPFHAAIIKCTKDCDHDCKAEDDIKIMSFGARVRMSKCFSSSCKRSFDIEEGSLLVKPLNSSCGFRRDRV
ncbi:hypothetical protein L6452_44264 [Arctium lappa]|uniref:Uncharacterized protein n=1 Tax=Arctium lappa TaxID=4217 RepID=A0ACB8XJ74_ARCLA|nr:hypothetical protein L6452_44264 [Arctium lappa]